MNAFPKKTSSQPGLCNDPSKRGAALLIVIFSLVLLSAILVGFFDSVTADKKASALYSDLGTTKQLSNTAINVVIAQIRAATSGSANDPSAWASQPGAIRRYDVNGNFVAGYKLYTSETMLETSSELNMVSSDLPPSTWRSQPGLYTDLNAPAMTVSGTLAFPIIDGNGINSCNVSGSAVLTYDADGDGKPDVAGFSIDPQQAGFNPALALSSSNTPVAMPVRWHYLLQDGRIVVPTLSGSTASIAGATKANPIIGRMAFWTDDETCKVNINTASYENMSPTTSAGGGDLFTTYHAYHSQPFCDGTAERNLAQYQPARGEVQRFPGHPATTNLGVVFPTLSDADLFKIAPRIAKGGSLGGTTVTTGTVDPGSDRLYASTGELLYSGSVSGSNRVFNSSTLNASMVERARFFVTARSRAPELNLFGKPRVAIWPIHNTNDAAHRTGFDQLIAFCSSSVTTSGTAKYYLLRSNPNSPTVDQQIASNQALFGNATNTSYLQNLTNSNIPGFGGNFAAKYGEDRDQILTEIEDYIRCANLNDPLLTTGQYTTPNPLATTGDISAAPGHGQVAPLYNSVNDTRGMGRFATISGIALQIICTADAQIAMSNTSTNLTLGGTLLTGTSPSSVNTQRRVEAMLHLESFTPASGPGAIGHLQRHQQPRFSHQPLAAFSYGQPWLRPEWGVSRLGRL